MGRGVFDLARLAISIGAATVSFSAGCLLELDHPISCGDGYIDALAGEECDPAASFDVDGCRESGLGNADTLCDATTCTLMLSEDDCASCGDGVASGAELCDGFDFRPGVVCPSGKGELGCDDDCQPDLKFCDPCGDGFVDESIGEECDPGVPKGGFTLTEPCSEIAVTATGVDKPAYTAGTVSAEDCTDECRYDRTPCSFCGDGEWDAAYQDLGKIGPIDRGETCDGSENDPIAHTAFCEQACFDNPDIVAYEVSCGAQCRNDCGGFEFTDPEPPDDPDPQDDLGCCLKTGSSCASAPFVCCLELIDDEPACHPIFDNMQDPIGLTCQDLG